MKRILLALTKVAFEPDEATEYHPILGVGPDEPSISAPHLLLLYAAPLMPFVVRAALLEIEGEWIIGISFLILGIGLALAAIHLTVGFLVTLALSLLAIANDSLGGLYMLDEIRILGAVFVYLPLSFALQARARSRKNRLYRWLQLPLTALVLFGGWFLRSDVGAPYVWAGVALGALSLVGSSEIGEEEPLSVVSAIVALVAGFGMNWHLYALIFAPGDWSVWLRIVQGGFAALATLVMAFTAFVVLALAEEQEQPFDYSWQLLFFVLSALAWADSLPIVLLVALVAVVWTWLAFPSWHTIRKGSSVAGSAVTIILCAAICAFLAAMLVWVGEYREALARLFLPEYRLLLDPYSLFIVIGIVFTVSVPHWTTILAAVATSVGPLLIERDVLSALAMGGGLGAVGALLGYTHVLLWPSLALLTLWLRHGVRRATSPGAEDCLLATQLAEMYRHLPGSLGSDALLAALARKGVSAEQFGWGDAGERYRVVQARQYEEAVRSAASLDEALQIDTTPQLDGTLEPVVESLRSAEEVTEDILRVRAFAAAIRDLTDAVEKRRERASASPWEASSSEAEQTVEEGEAKEGDDRLPLDDQVVQHAPVNLPPAALQGTAEEDLSSGAAFDHLGFSYWMNPQVLRLTNQAWESLRQLAYEEIRPIVSVYWETYAAFPDFSRSDEEEPEWTDREEIMAASERCLSGIRGISKGLTTIKPYGNQLPDRERSYLRELEAVTRRLVSMPREMDYQARSRVTEESSYIVSRMRAELPASWPAIALDEDRVVDHANPWLAYADALERQISCLAELNERMFKWVTGQVVEALEAIENVNDLASLTKSLDRLSGFGERYGPIIDVTIKSLESVGRDAAAALAFPRGYSRRLGLQDALDQVNKLRSDLSTRYLMETVEITDALGRVAQMLYDHLYAAAESEAGVYRNPYIAGNPINLDRAALFKGRLDLAEEIVALLRHRGNPTVVLYGPRRMGKTSFLLQLPRLLPSDYLPVFLDMQQGGAQQSDGSFTYALAYAIWRQLRSEATIERPDLDDHETHPYTAMDTWLDEVQPILGERILFFTIDEFEAIGRAIERGSLTVQVLEHLRSLMQHHENLLLMFAGVQTIDALGPDPASYFISAHPVEISYLHPREAEALIRSPDPRAGRMPDYDDKVVADILRRTHRQPYLIQAICSEIIEMANVGQLTRIEMETLDRAADRVLDTSLLFQNIWDDAEEEGQDVLRRLAAGPQPLNRMAAGEDLLQGLLRRHVICEGDGAYEIEIPLLRNWIQREIGGS